MWSVILKPHETDEPDPIRGLAVYLVNDEVGDDRIEAMVSRVAFARRHGKNPDASFIDQLELEIQKGMDAADRLTILDSDLEAAMEQRRESARKHISELFGGLVESR